MNTVKHEIINSLGESVIVDLTVDPGDHSLDVEAMIDQYEAGSDVAFEGDTDRNQPSELEQAYRVLTEYGSQDEDGWFRPTYVENGSFQTMAERFSEISGREAADCLFEMQQDVYNEKIAVKRSRPSRVFDRVSLDLDPSDRFVQDLDHPAAPQVIFMQIRPTSAAYRKSEVDADGVITRLPRTCMAVWFQPEIENHGSGFHAVNPYRSPKNGRYYCTDKFMPGYLGVVAWFASMQDASDAADDLRRAVRTIGQRSISARVSDTVRDVHDDEARAADKQRRQQQRRVRVESAF